MKYTKQQIIEKVKSVNSNFTEEKLDLILDTFFNVETRPPLNSKTFKLMREKSGLKFNAKYATMEVEALVKLGFELPPTENEKTSKRYMVEQVCKMTRASKAVVTRVYENLIHSHRVSADALSRSLPGLIGESSHNNTIKKIESLFTEMGAKVKPVYKKTGAVGGGTKGMKLNDTIVIDDGVIRWNPAKLMPKPFAHLDNAW